MCVACCGHSCTGRNAGFSHAPVRPHIWSHLLAPNQTEDPQTLSSRLPVGRTGGGGRGGVGAPTSKAGMGGALGLLSSSGSRRQRHARTARACKQCTGRLRGSPGRGRRRSSSHGNVQLRLVQGLERHAAVVLIAGEGEGLDHYADLVRYI